MTDYDTITTDALPKTFQALTDEDQQTYGAPRLIYLDPPPSADPASAAKRENWINWRAAPYPADRHSEYLYLPFDGDTGPKILLCACMPSPESFDAYLAMVSRKHRYDIRGAKATSLGYTAAPIRPAEQAEQIWNVIHSSDTRQDRPIAKMFAERPRDCGFPEYADFADPNYQDICCGVFAPGGELAAYLLGKRVGHHVQYDEIMGHADHLRNSVMYLLHRAFLELCIASPIAPQCLNYGPWYSGSSPFSSDGGLNRWKRKARFEPAFLILASS